MRRVCWLDRRLRSSSAVPIAREEFLFHVVVEVGFVVEFVLFVEKFRWSGWCSLPWGFRCSCRRSLEGVLRLVFVSHSTVADGAFDGQLSCRV